jgi:hypothetical protein
MDLYATRIDRDHHRVVTTWGARVTDAALMTYQQTVWRDPSLKGFDELIDFRALAEIEVTTEGLEGVAHVAAGMDAEIGQSRFAIVVSDSLSFGLSRMYEALREVSGKSSRKVMIFQRMEEALAWLDGR